MSDSAAEDQARIEQQRLNVRAFWRSTIVATAMRHAALLRIVPWGASRLSELPAEVQKPVERICGEQLDECFNAESRLNHHRAAIEQRMNAALWHALKPWARADDPVPRETNIQHDEAVTP